MQNKQKQVFGKNKKHAELGKNLSFHISTSYDRLYSNVEASFFTYFYIKYVTLIDITKNNGII